MKLGAERNKVVVLAALIAVAIVVYMVNSAGEQTSSSPVQSSRPAAQAPAAGSVPTPDRPAASRATGRNRGGTEFKPRVGARRGEERADPASIDPTLRLDVLAKLQQVKVEGTRRSIFDFSQPPAPKPDPKEIAAAKKPVPSPLVKPEDPKPEAETAALAKPQAPPIPLKFYGYLSRSTQPSKRAFFMDGDEIHVVSEGDTVKKRYKVVRIGINSVVVEDTQFGQQQTLPLLEEQPG
jgi:hypothetical protein